MTGLRVGYLGAYDPAYPRNLILRRGLEAGGASVVECRVSSRLNSRQRAQVLAAQMRALSPRPDVLILAEFNQSLALPARRLAQRLGIPLVIDAFTPVYDSAVHDRAVTGPRSLAALRYWLIDWLAVRLGDRVLVDTGQHRDYFIHAFGARADVLRVIPVGAPHEWLAAAPPLHGGAGLLASFYGTFIPLHGIDTILRAAHRLADRPDIRFEITGRGQTFTAMRALAGDLALENVSFLDPVPPGDLPARAGRGDLALGIFGTTAKAARVVPNKVYQMLALGRPVITADSPALREMFAPGEDLAVVPPGDPRALAEQIAALAGDPARRAALAQTGRRHIEEAYTEAALGRRLLDALP